MAACSSSLCIGVDLLLTGTVDSTFASAVSEFRGQ